MLCLFISIFRNKLNLYAGACNSSSFSGVKLTVNQINLLIEDTSLNMEE